MRGKCLPALAAATAALLCAAPCALAGLTPAERALLAEVNDVRAAHGVGPLRVDPKLEAAARAHSAEMLLRGYFGHTSFETRIRATGAYGPAFGENLAWGVGPAGSAAAIVRVWLRSPPHRRNLLRPGWRRAGIGAPRGVFFGYAGARVVTLDFAGT